MFDASHSIIASYQMPNTAYVLLYNLNSLRAGVNRDYAALNEIAVLSIVVVIGGCLADVVFLSTGAVAPLQRQSHGVTCHLIPQPQTRSIGCLLPTGKRKVQYVR